MRNKILTITAFIAILLIYTVTCQAQDYYKLSSELGGRFIYGQNLTLKANQSTNLYYPTKLKGFYGIKIKANSTIYINTDTLKTYASEIEYRFYTDKPFNIYILSKEKTKVAIAIHYFGNSSK